MTVIPPWQDLLTPAMRPLTAQPDLALDGYLTGVIVAPRPVPLHRWLAVLWRDEDRNLWNAGRVKAERDAIVRRQAGLAAAIDWHLARLETDRVCDYRPAFIFSDDKPAHAAIRCWVGGFFAAMTLVPDAWTALLEDSRTEILVAPFVGFIGLEDAEPFEMADDVDRRLDDHAAFIPRAILILRKLARMRTVSRPYPSVSPPAAKVGRNDACPCSSCVKYKRCCGRH